MLQCKTCLNRYDRMWHENDKGVLRPSNSGPKKYIFISLRSYVSAVTRAVIYLTRVNAPRPLKTARQILSICPWICFFVGPCFAKRGLSPRHYHKLINRSEITDAITKQFATRSINRPHYHINLKRGSSETNDRQAIEPDDNHQRIMAECWNKSDRIILPLVGWHHQFWMDLIN